MLACHLVQHAMLCKMPHSGASVAFLKHVANLYPHSLCLDAHCRLTQDAFHMEVAILKACRNKNIVAYIADYVDDERTWLIMEHMEV